MPHKNPSNVLKLAVALVAVTIILLTAASAANKESVLHNFGAANDGAEPTSSLIPDTAGNLYGTTLAGGVYGFGTVFKLTPDSKGGWTEKVIFSFDSRENGVSPNDGLALDSAGNLYGTTQRGGKVVACDGLGCGSVFQLSLSGGKWKQTVLYKFTGCKSDGCQPESGLVFDKSGNIYGTTFSGPNGFGTVFTLKPKSGSWTESLAYTFLGPLKGDGEAPHGSLTFDTHGNLFGTTEQGGAGANCGVNGCGTVFELTPVTGGWQEKVAYSFTGGDDGISPYAALTLDSAGNLYSTTRSGGSHNFGVVFKLSPVSGGWTEAVIYTFGQNTGDGSYPLAAVVFDSAGDLYGTTIYGGDPKTCSGSGCGTIYRLSPGSNGTWNESMIHRFTAVTDGANPNSSLFIDSAGNLYGTTDGAGGQQGGIVFEITP